MPAAADGSVVLAGTQRTSSDVMPVLVGPEVTAKSVAAARVAPPTQVLRCRPDGGTTCTSYVPAGSETDQVPSAAETAAATGDAPVVAYTRTCAPRSGSDAAVTVPVRAPGAGVTNVNLLFALTDVVPPGVVTATST